MVKKQLSIMFKSSLMISPRLIVLENVNKQTLSARYKSFQGFRHSKLNRQRQIASSNRLNNQRSNYQFRIPILRGAGWPSQLHPSQGHVREVGKLAYLRQTQRLVWNFGKTLRGLPKKVISNLSFQADEDLPTYSYQLVSKN